MRAIRRLDTILTAHVRGSAFKALASPACKNGNDAFLPNSGVSRVRRQGLFRGMGCRPQYPSEGPQWYGQPTSPDPRGGDADAPFPDIRRMSGIDGARYGEIIRRR